MCLRYSSSVVAPMVCSSPRASIGFSMFAASIDPSAAPAPTTVCSSSMKRTIWPSASDTSFRTAFRRSSNSPRYFAPAISAPMSSATMRLSFSPSGTSPRTIRWARPSTMAVLPTPGSPISTGLFFVRRDSTWITRRISSSRPITGIELALAGQLRQVAAVLLQRLVLAFGILVGDALIAAHRRRGASSTFSRVTPRARSWSTLGRAAGLGQEAQQQVLGADVLVLHAPSPRPAPRR